MHSDQPDLFGEYDRQQEQRALWQQPATCPSCGTTELSGYTLSNNHGYDPVSLTIGGHPQGDHPIYGAQCLAQNLVTNHITLAARRTNPEVLAEHMERGRRLGLDVDAIARRATESPQQD